VLLVILQLVAAPFASAFAGAVPDAGCSHSGTIHAWHADDGCDDGVLPGSGAGSTGHGYPQAGHQCHCVHAVAQVPIIGTLIGTPRAAARAGSIDGRLQGPAYSAPLFEILRPPS
jgi:hypothetical protein